MGEPKIAQLEAIGAQSSFRQAFYTAWIARFLMMACAPLL